MKVIFEDDGNDLLSKLFRYAYKDTSNFIYVHGNSNIISAVNNLAVKEHVYVYIDSVPANTNIKGIYKNLVSLANHRGNMLIFPIVCSEYYFIKAFGNIQDSDINVCISKGNYFNTGAFHNDRVYCRTFEKYCKYLIRHNVMNCMSHDVRNPEYGTFYTKDCLCKYSEVACRQMSLIEKSVTYISQYDCVPSGSTGSIKTPVNNLYDIHVKLVDEFNSFSSYLKSVDTRKDVKYFNLHKQHNVIWT